MFRGEKNTSGDYTDKGLQWSRALGYTIFFVYENRWRLINQVWIILCISSPHVHFSCIFKGQFTVFSFLFFPLFVYLFFLLSGNQSCNKYFRLWWYFVQGKCFLFCLLYIMFLSILRCFYITFSFILFAAIIFPCKCYEKENNLGLCSQIRNKP